MRICHLTTFVQGGAGYVITELACSQARAGHDVALVTSRTAVPGYGNYPDYLTRLHSCGVRILLIDSLFSRDSRLHEQVLATINRSWVGARGFDLLHAHAGVPAAIAMAARAHGAWRAPVVQTMHGWGVSKTTAQATHDVAVMNRVDRVVVPARASAGLLTSLGVRPPQVAVVAYGVAEPRGAVPDALALQMETWRCAGDRVLCAIGTLGARKNQRLLIEALSTRDLRRRTRLVLIGDGADAGLRAAAIALGIADRVCLAGYRANARRYLRHADLLVLPSRAEGQPLAVLEAFCDATSVLVSAVPELVELVDDGVTGWTFEPDNAAALADAIAWTIRLDRRERHAVVTRARAAYETRFTLARMVDDYMAEYRRVA